MSYVQRDETGRIVGIYASPRRVFQQALTYHSTGRLKERLSEYPKLLEEAEKRGEDVDATTDFLLANWPEQIDNPRIGDYASVNERADQNAEHEPVGASASLLPDGADDSGAISGAPEGGAAVSGVADQDGTPAPVEPDDTNPAESISHPGVMILPDELGARRFVVRGMIAEERTIRTEALREPGWMEELTQLRGWLVDDARTDAHALPPMTQEQRDRLARLEGVESRIAQIEAYAGELDRTARDATREVLDAMVAGLSQGWPA